MEFLATPLGFIMRLIYQLVNNYFAAIFLFTLLVRLLMFPISLKSQKSSAERARLAPRLERLQKKYGQDPRKLQEKQQALYEKEGVSMTGGCLPMVIQMIVLFGIIAVIYQPLSHLSQLPAPVISASVSAVTLPEGATAEEYPHKVPAKELSGYYKELRLLRALEPNSEDIQQAIIALEYTPEQAQKYYNDMLDIREEFSIFGMTLLENPWNGGFRGINWLWIIPLLSGLTAFLSGWISLQYMKGATSGPQQMQGCSNVMMLGMMPLFSLIITFTVPGGVGVYWICSNVIAIGQTVLLNHIYNPAKIRAQAEQEYEERRKRKAEDKKRLAEARAREEAEARRAAQEEKEQREEKKRAAAQAKQPAASKNPNKLKRRAANDNQAVAAPQEDDETPPATPGEDEQGKD